MQTRQLRQILTLSLLMLVFILAISSSEPAAAAGPWYVAPGGADGNDCLSPGTPCETIHGALGKASSGDTIYVATGTYTRSGTPVLLVSKDILLSGGWDLSFTSQDGYSTIDGEDTHRGITINSGLTVELERFEITNSSTGSTGGGIQVISSNLTVRDRRSITIMLTPAGVESPPAVARSPLYAALSHRITVPNGVAGSSAAAPISTSTTAR